MVVGCSFPKDSDNHMLSWVWNCFSHAQVGLPSTAVRGGVQLCGGGRGVVSCQLLPLCSTCREVHYLQAAPGLPFTLCNRTILSFNSNSPVGGQLIHKLAACRLRCWSYPDAMPEPV